MTNVFIEQVLLCSKAENGEVDGRAYLKRLIKKPGRYRTVNAGRLATPTSDPIRTLSTYRYMSGKEMKEVPIDEIRIEKQTKQTCAFSSLAAAYSAVNDVMAKEVIQRNIDNSLVKDPFQFATDLLRTGKLNIDVQSFGWMRLDPMLDRSEWPTMCQLLGDDGTVNHCVTLMGEFIFESNTDKPMDINRENLDWCVSTDKVKCRFLGVIKAVRFSHKKKKKEWKLNVAGMSGDV